MRIRYAMYKHGEPCEMQVECDMTKKDAEAMYKELETNARCGWAEMVAEEDEEGGYMNIVKSFDHIDVAKAITSLFG